MAGDNLGVMFRVTNWGESHGAGVGIVVEGCPPNIEISIEDIQVELDRRRPGQSSITTPRQEKDQVEILSGLYQGKTTGTAISMVIWNTNQRSQDYSEMERLFRPSHADYTYNQKYGLRDPAGGGRSSARATAGTVMAGAIAQKILKQWFKVEIISYVRSIKNLEIDILPETVTREKVEQNILRCPDSKMATRMIEQVEAAKKSGDSLGGVIETIAQPMPVGLGEPFYDKLEADLAKAILAINACKGFEIGSGFAGTQLSGSKHNDEFLEKDGKVLTKTNRSGGVQGGISNGMPLLFRAAFKPTATILREQKTVNLKLEEQTFTAKGRHDPCVLPRAVPIVEASTAIILLDHALRFRGQTGQNF